VSSGDVALDQAAEAFTGVFIHNGHDLDRSAVGGGVVGLLGDLQLTADVSDVLALVQHPISGRQLAHDLLRRVRLPRSHVDVEPSCPQRGPQDSQTTWIN
jgi:hypothetical protein